jgi:hypothetical protein
MACLGPLYGCQPVANEHAPECPEAAPTERELPLHHPADCPDHPRATLSLGEPIGRINPHAPPTPAGRFP